jgi:hypothetical protein
MRREDAVEIDRKGALEEIRKRESAYLTLHRRDCYSYLNFQLLSIASGASRYSRIDEDRHTSQAEADDTNTGEGVSDFDDFDVDTLGPMTFNEWRTSNPAWVALCICESPCTALTSSLGIRRDRRPWKQKRRETDANWRKGLLGNTNAYLDFNRGLSVPPTSFGSFMIDNVVDMWSGNYFHFAVIVYLTGWVLRYTLSGVERNRSIQLCGEARGNRVSSLLRHGLMASSPVSPRTAVTTRSLDWFIAASKRQPNYGLYAFVETICDFNNVSAIVACVIFYHLYWRSTVPSGNVLQAPV